jgi:branched-chain amino acid transport system permease protein
MLTGVAGQISLGNAAFMGVGACVAGVFGAQLHWPFLAVIASAAVISGIVGAVAGTPALRLRGLYLIIATLALQYIIVWGIQSIQSSTVGVAGWILPVASVGSWSITSPITWYLVLLVFAAAVTMIHVNIGRTRIGRAWSAIREKDIAAEILGVPVGRYKINAFVLTSALIGMQGALLAYFVGVVSYDMFTLSIAITYVAMIIIGGLGSYVGAIYGAIFVTGLPYVLPSVFGSLPSAIAVHLQNQVFNIEGVVYGLLIIVFLVFEPKGIAELTRRARRYFVLWPFSRERLAEEVE